MPRIYTGGVLQGMAQEHVCALLDYHSERLELAYEDDPANKRWVMWNADGKVKMQVLLFCPYCGMDLRADCTWRVPGKPHLNEVLNAATYVGETTTNLWDLVRELQVVRKRLGHLHGGPELIQVRVLEHLRHAAFGPLDAMVLSKALLGDPRGLSDFDIIAEEKLKVAGWLSQDGQPTTRLVHWLKDHKERERGIAAAPMDGRPWQERIMLDG